MHKQIIIQDYSPQWQRDFELLKAVFADRLNGLISDIQHVGSTSVVGLAAKPVIDIDLIIDDREMLNEVTAALSTLGYEHIGDMGSEIEKPLSGSQI